MCSRELEDAVRDLEDGGVVGLRMEAGTVAGRKEAVAPKPMHGDAPEGPSVGGGGVYWVAELGNTVKEMHMSSPLHALRACEAGTRVRGERALCKQPSCASCWSRVPLLPRARTRNPRCDVPV